MKFKVNGKTLSADRMRVREVCEAEAALGLSLDETGFGGKVAVALYVAMRRDDAERSPGLIADEVLDADMGDFELIEDGQSPPAESESRGNVPTTDEEAEAPASLPTSGHLRSAV